MTHFRSIMLSSILVAVSLSNVAFLDLEGSIDPSSIGARNNPVDFEVTGIEMGNDTLSPRVWTQPDSDSLEYMTKGETIQINVTFQQKGVDPTPTYADAKLEIWHPIGIMIAEWDFNITLIAGSSERVSFVWTPSIAHSSLSDDGWLSGGVILRGTVDAGIGIDGDETNNLLDREVPVAFWYDPMENGFCDDEANEGKFCTNSPVGYGVPTWYAAGYVDGYNPDTNNFPTGTWRMDNESSPTGEWHWKVSGDNNNYASNRYDRLTWAWQRINSQDGCADGVANPDYSHGLGYGEHDPTLSSIHIANLCLVKIDSPALYSIQIVTDAWGEMGAGDSIVMETDSGAGGNTEFLNYSSMNLSSVEGDWKRVVWNASGLHQNEGFTVSLLFRSNSSFSDAGVHIDSFIIFAIEEGEEYTLDAECSFPDNFGGTMVYDPESEGGNTILVEAADPDPPSLHCIIFNKGYVDTKLNLFTEVSNRSWMSQFPLRIDSNNFNDNDNFVQTRVIKARTYTQVWINLSIPDGTPVQDLVWYTWINDGIQNQSNKYYVELPVSVMPTYRMIMKQETLANPAATILPGGKANISMEMKNTGNQYSSWALGGSFSDSEIDDENLKWYEPGGDEVTTLNLTPIEDILLYAEVSIPEGTGPGVYEIDLEATPRLPNNFQASSRIYIEVPVFHDLAIAPVKDRMVAPADGTLQSVQIFMFNNGNTEETFDLRIDTDEWRLGAYLSKNDTTLEANGGQTTISLKLPMPNGVKNGTYRISIIGTSQQNQQYQAQSNFYLTVTKTYVVGVEDRDLSDEVFAAGTDPRTLKWEIWNHGNEDDSFEIELSFPSDVSAMVSGTSDGKTPHIPPGSSYNLSLSYSFDSGVNGPRIIELRATSVESGEFTEAEARFEVGTVGFLLVLSPSSQSNSAEIIEPGDDYIIVFPIRSAHPEIAQQIRADVELDNLWTIYDARVHEDDRNFVLSPGESRNVTIHLDIRDENLQNLPENIVEFNISLVLISELDTTVRTSQITLVKPEPIPEGPDVEQVGWMAANYLLIIIGVSFMGGILFASFRVFRDASAPLEEHSSLSDYSMTVDGWDGQKISGGDLPSADEIANSMYGGAKELFEQPPPPSIPDNLPRKIPEGNSPPPIPDEGLPEGWTTEQWNFYGQKWLDSQREE